MAALQLVLDPKLVPGLKGQQLSDMLALFKSSGAPNLQVGKLPSRVDDKRAAISKAIQLYENKTWVVPEMEEIYATGSDSDDSMDEELEVVKDADDNDDQWEDD